MKRTIEIADPLFRNAKSKAAERGQTLEEFVAEALKEKIARRGEPKWMQGFGELSRLHGETARVQARIDRVFDVIDSEDQVRS